MPVTLLHHAKAKVSRHFLFSLCFGNLVGLVVGVLKFAFSPPVFPSPQLPACPRVSQPSADLGAICVE